MSYLLNSLYDSLVSSARTKITFFNEMREIGKQLGINSDKVFELTTLSAEGIWNPTYGINDKGSFSGSCLPKDTQAFFSWAESSGFKVDLLKSVINVNSSLNKKLPEKKPTGQEPK